MIYNMYCDEVISDKSTKYLLLSIIVQFPYIAINLKIFILMFTTVTYRSDSCNSLNVKVIDVACMMGLDLLLYCIIS